LTAAAVPLSLYRLSMSPMWSDETASVSISVQHGHALWSAISSDGGSMSAYYLLLHTLFLAGMGESAVSVRLVSVIAYVATVPFLYGLVRRCFGTPIAVIATALVMTNRTVISKAQETRGYTLGLLLVVVATWLLALAVERSTRPRWLAWTITSALACYTLLLSPLFAAAQALSLGTVRRKAGLSRSALVSYGLLAVLLVPLGLLALHRGTAQIDWVARIGVGSVKGDLSAVFVPRFPTPLRWMMIAAVGVGILKAGREIAVSRPGSLERWHYVLLLSWAGFPLAAMLLISVSVSLLVPGYLIASIPAFAVLGALGLATVAELVAAGALGVVATGSSTVAKGESRQARRPVAWVGWLFVAVAAPFLVLVPLVESWGTYGTVIENGPGETAYVVGFARAGDAIIFDQPSQRMIFDYYLLSDFHKTGTFPVLPSPIWPSAPWGTQLPYAADHRLPTPSGIAALDDRFTRIWVVDGGWARLPGYVAESHALLLALSREYPVVGEDDFRGARVLLFSRSGSPPPGMQPWTGPG